MTTFYALKNVSGGVFGGYYKNRNKRTETPRMMNRRQLGLALHYIRNTPYRSFVETDWIIEVYELSLKEAKSLLEFK